MHLVDLSHVIEDKMTTYPGLPGPQMGEHLSFEASVPLYAPGTEFAIRRPRLEQDVGKRRRLLELTNVAHPLRPLCLG